MIDYIWLAIAFPLLGVVINGLFGKWLGRRLNGLIGVAAVAAAFVVGVLVFLQAPAHGHSVTLWDWITIGDFHVGFSLLVDPLSVLMTLIVTGVGMLIHIYAIGYMDHDPGNSRFFTYLNLFIVSMLVLVLSDNFFGLYAGWELVGVCSYLLIGFWFQKPEAADAGKKAFIVNRVGDFGFALGVFLIWTTFGTLQYAEVFEMAPEILAVSSPVVIAITALLAIGAFGKSAQIPLYVWLPDAMEGPTPVSALIHAATMVTAGVYMIVRSNVLYTMAPETSFFVALIGVLTALFAATIALVQFDLKRVLAYSTISQLGYMVFAAGVGAYTSAIFHLMTHAFFKALLFMAAGSVMHAMQDVIDMRRLGGLKAKMPATYWTFLIGALALAGFPLTAGFFSKDEILAVGMVNMPALAIIGFIAAALTAFYTFRAVFMTFHGDPKDQALFDHAHENKPVMTVPLMILAALSLLGGFLGLPAALGLPHWLEHWLEPIFENMHHISHGANHPEFGLEVVLIIVSSLIAIGGIAAAWWVYMKNPHIATNTAQRFSGIYNLLLNKYYVDELYDKLFVNPGKRFGRWLTKHIDQGIIDGMLVDGSAKVVGWVGKGFSAIQTGYVSHYVTAIFLGGLILFFYFFLR